MELTREEEMKWAQVEIYAQMDNWIYEDDCREHFGVKMVTTNLYRQYLRFRFPKLFAVAEGKF